MFKRRIDQPLSFTLLIIALPCIIFGLFMLPTAMVIAENWTLFLKLLIFSGFITLGYILDDLPEMIDVIKFDHKTYGWRNLFIFIGLIIPMYSMSLNGIFIQTLLIILITIIFIAVSSFGFITILFKHITQSTLPLQPEYLIVKIIMLISVSIPLVYWLSKGWNVLPVFMLLGLFSHGFSLVYMRKIQLYVFFRCATFVLVLLSFSQLKQLIIIWELGLGRWIR